MQVKNCFAVNVCKFSKRIRSATAVAGLVGLAGIASATPMTGPAVDLSFPGPNGLFPEGWLATTITLNTGSGNIVNSRVAAGMFGGVATSVAGGFDASLLYRSQGDVLAYCIDILNNLLKSQNTYHVNDITQNMVVDHAGVRRDFGRTLSFLGAANQVAKQQFGISEGEKNWLNPNTKWMSAAIQVGIWESLYEKDATPLTAASGWFAATTLGVLGDKFLVDSFALLNGAAPPVAVSASTVKWLQINGGQDLLVDPVDVPAPAPLLLLLSGLALLWRRSR
ncbi:MAG: hypothetical protein NWQ45_09775 [Congregibacter sp.]|nr:hypothetical protein [Congregibacter sp.]